MTEPWRYSIVHILIAAMLFAPLGSQSFGDTSCQTLAQNASLYTDVDGLRTWAEVMRTFNSNLGQELSGSSAWLLQEKSVVDHYLRSGSVSEIHDKFDFSFYRAENAYLRITLLTKKLGVATNSADKASIQQQLNDELATFGKYYLSYRVMRVHMEKIANDQTCVIGNCRIKAGDALSFMGLASKNAYADARLGAESITTDALPNSYVRPAIDEMDNFFASDAGAPARIESMKWERRKGAMYLAGLFFSRPPLRAALYSVVKTFESTPGSSLNFGVARLFLTDMYNLRAKISHFPNLVELDRSSDNVAQKTERITALEASDPEFLLTFARKVDSRQMWIDVREYAKTSERYKDLYDKMVALEQPGSPAKKLGNIAPDYKVALPSRIADWLVIAGIAMLVKRYMPISFLSIFSPDDKDKDKNKQEADQMDHFADGAQSASQNPAVAVPAPAGG